MNYDEVDRVLGNLVRAVKILENCAEFAELIPEVRTNIVYALPNAKKVEEVAGIEGRITKIGSRAKACGYPGFGASSHMERIVLEVMKIDRRLRAGINFAWSEKLASWLKEWANSQGISFGHIDRSKEPEAVSKAEGVSIPWKIRFLLDHYGIIPRIFYESAGMGKEPLFVVLGEDAVSVATLSTTIAREWKRQENKLGEDLSFLH